MRCELSVTHCGIKEHLSLTVSVLLHTLAQIQGGVADRLKSHLPQVTQLLVMPVTNQQLVEGPTRRRCVARLGVAGVETSFRIRCVWFCSCEIWFCGRRGHRKGDRSHNNSTCSSCGNFDRLRAARRNPTVNEVSDKSVWEAAGADGWAVAVCDGRTHESKFRIDHGRVD